LREREAIDVDEVVLNRHWKRQGRLLGIFLLLLVICYYPSYSSIVSVWIRSETFAHGFLILPICAWLIWRIRDQIRATLPQTNYLGVPVLLGLGFLWLAANYVGVLAIEQLAAALMIPVLVFSLLGWQTTSVMAFPLLFILFGVPLGEELTPFLINFTADFTVTMIQWTGIPIYREGTFFELPSGSWSVVAACSGVRYLIASVTLGVLYAYLNYQSLLKRSMFTLASVGIPIIANSLRAFMIVMIAHFSDMKLATGVDHLIYGWFFFGIVIAIMFYVGSFWRDDATDIQVRSIGLTLGNLGNRVLPYRLTVATIAIALIFWPVKFQLEQQTLDFSRVAEITVSTPAGWVKKPADSKAWKPAYHGLDREFLSAYKDADGNKVTLFIGYYAQQRQDAELGNYNNVLVTEKDEVWRAIQKQGLLLPNVSVNAPTAVIKGNSKQYLTTYLFYVDGQWATNKYQTKWLQAKARLLGGRNDGAIIAITSQQQGESAETAELLKGFAAAALAKTKFALDQM